MGVKTKDQGLMSSEEGRAKKDDLRRRMRVEDIDMIETLKIVEDMTYLYIDHGEIFSESSHHALGLVVREKLAEAFAFWPRADFLHILAFGESLPPAGGE